MKQQRKSRSIKIEKSIRKNMGFDTMYTTSNNYFTNTRILDGTKMSKMSFPDDLRFDA